LKLPIENWDDKIRSLDLDNNGNIDFREFLTAAVDHSKFLTQENIDEVFKVFDKNDDKVITIDEFEFFLPSSKWK